MLTTVVAGPAAVNETPVSFHIFGKDLTVALTRGVKMIQVHPTLGSTVMSFLTLLVEQTTRSHTADDETHAAEDGSNNTKDDCYDKPSFFKFVKNRPVERETEQLCQHVLTIMVSA